MKTLILSFLMILSTNNSSKTTTISELSPEETHIRWYIVNDGVMGGLSQGKFMFSKDETGLFTGNISLDNNGGFSWLKGYDPEMNIDEAEGIQIRVKGDGRKFGLTLMNSDRRRAMYFTSTFETLKDEWQEISIPLKDLKGRFYGQNVNAVTSMNKSMMNEIGFILYDKNDGPFSLEIDWIKAY